MAVRLLERGGFFVVSVIKRSVFGWEDILRLVFFCLRRKQGRGEWVTEKEKESLQRKTRELGGEERILLTQRVRYFLKVLFWLEKQAARDRGRNVLKEIP